MKDSQPRHGRPLFWGKYIKENNERFSTGSGSIGELDVSISRRIMKDSQRLGVGLRS